MAAVEPGTWLRRFSQPATVNARLLCFPHAGGSANFFRDWSSSLPQNVELLAVQYPGHADRVAEKLITDMGELVDFVTSALARKLDRPLALFGHSLGAWVAYEVARRVEQACPELPIVLLVSAAAAPHRSGRPNSPYRCDESLWTQIARLDGTVPAILADPGLRQMLLPILRADSRIVDTYAPQPAPKLRCPIFGYFGSEDDQVTARGVGDWKAVTTGHFRMRLFPGHHFYLLSCRTQLLEDLSCRLKDLQDGVPPQTLPCTCEHQSESNQSLS